MTEDKPKFENPITHGPMTEETARLSRIHWALVTHGERVASTQMVVDMSEIIQFAVDGLREVSETKTIGAAKHVASRTIRQIQSRFEVS
ncbi:hypothetical protein [Pseudorhodoplanes sp.]|uniref:hypothetical protein n=1 Tax=Pseudorhodoplanes sp. TaxID=1934341 RepID=UPI002CD80B37|nr:hypothetical protein [Pseudorhodoplanes sp.]HWV44078.1 hypothetical protein [Pseudorhodoplanes sp.]